MVAREIHSRVDEGGPFGATGATIPHKRPRRNRPAILVPDLSLVLLVFPAGVRL